ncbi:FtsQ-type POTRA domain-containing protein [Leptotrichia sp. OH3620_COT-345]|uniref:cell division protein FtsQ/DivIB n=1 Tax=Leptotrichia sp. OH3620_COT-345 TaxID=2491048 RepID=UPI000F6513C5|nr:FtsQ-type POTRA domain-containing protein [Leptotrichia sp. OH3620_COT-345]RRD38424.1 FtsQ-type POTRA domain-containing protein [Leptotrichia sp. OH3620_COT-345]
MQKFIKTVFMLSLLFGLIYFGKRFIETDYFKINEITVTGENNLLKDDIINKIENLKGNNIVYINTGKLEELLEKDARVKKIIIRKVYPSKLIVELDERIAFVYVKKGDDIFLADRELNLFGHISEMEPKNIPVVMYSDEESLKDVKIILSKIKNKDLYDMISEIRKRDKMYELVLKNGVRVITDTFVSSEKYDSRYKLYERIKNEQTINYMDIRFKDVNVK